MVQPRDGKIQSAPTAQQRAENRSFFFFFNENITENRILSLHLNLMVKWNVFFLMNRKLRILALLIS